ncbi:MAG: hypothetical protein LBP92_06675 [Deltaproteobacteria bacterium]|jgi:hypothetical protein|nr:hypothetical protein [Deltaproteobacteria bacterium]
MKRQTSNVKNLIIEAMERLSDPGLKGEGLETEIRKAQALASLAKQYVSDKTADTEIAKTSLRACELAEEFGQQSIVGIVQPLQGIAMGDGDGNGNGNGNGHDVMGLGYAKR